MPLAALDSRRGSRRRLHTGSGDVDRIVVGEANATAPAAHSSGSASGTISATISAADWRCRTPPTDCPTCNARASTWPCRSRAGRAPNAGDLDEFFSCRRLSEPAWVTATTIGYEVGVTIHSEVGAVPLDDEAVEEPPGVDDDDADAVEPNEPA